MLFVDQFDFATVYKNEFLSYKSGKSANGVCSGHIAQAREIFAAHINSEGSSVVFQPVVVSEKKEGVSETSAYMFLREIHYLGV